LSRTGGIGFGNTLRSDVERSVSNGPKATLNGTNAGTWGKHLKNAQGKRECDREALLTSNCPELRRMSKGEEKSKKPSAGGEGDQVGVVPSGHAPLARGGGGKGGCLPGA